MRFFSFLSLTSLLSLLSCGYTSISKGKLAQQMGESVVFIGEEPAMLAHIPLRSPPVLVRSTYLPGKGSIDYSEGRDFIVDYGEGTLRRTAESRIPDFRKNILFGKEEFDHSKFPGFGNNGYFAFVDYTFATKGPWPVQPKQTQFLQSTEAKLKAGGDVKIVAFGDSITAGGDASKPELIFWRRWADELQKKYPRAKVMAVNGATGGDTTYQGLARLKEKVLDEKPDLVLVGFGMNDHNVRSVTLPQFEENLKQIVSKIRVETSAEVVLFSAFSPNPKWKFGSHHMADYAHSTAKVAQEMRCAYADVFSNWEAVAARKKPEDMLANNINHPNDFGHWIYFQVLAHLGL